MAEAKKRSQELRAEGAAAALIAKATASANGLKMISTAIHQTGGRDAANYLLGERFIDAY